MNPTSLRRVALSLGEIEYDDTGGPGAPIVLVHGLAMNGSVWRHVVAELRDRYRCIVPVLPEGGHRLPIAPEKDLSPHNVALLIGEFIEALNLKSPTVVENDSGRIQTLAAQRPELVGRLVLVSCEAFDNYPPGLAGKMVSAAARIPAGLFLMISSLRIRALRRLPMAWGNMSKRPIPNGIIDGWMAPLLENPAIRADLRRYLLAVKPNELTEAAKGLRNFSKPALIVWAREDRMMPLEHAHKLAEILPNSTLIELDDCYTLIPEDQPVRLARAIDRFITETAIDADPSAHLDSPSDSGLRNQATRAR